MMSTTSATKAHYLAAISTLRADYSERYPWDHDMNHEDYDDALDSIADAVEYHDSPEGGRYHGADHDFADAGAIYPQEWADANPRALDAWAAEAASEYGADVLTTGIDGTPAVDVLDRIRTVARYACLSATWHAAARDVERIAEGLADADPFAPWVSA